MASPHAPPPPQPLASGAAFPSAPPLVEMGPLARYAAPPPPVFGEPVAANSPALSSSSPPYFNPYEHYGATPPQQHPAPLLSGAVSPGSVSPPEAWRAPLPTSDVQHQQQQQQQQQQQRARSRAARPPRRRVCIAAVVTVVVVLVLAGAGIATYFLLRPQTVSSGGSGSGGGSGGGGGGGGGGSGGASNSGAAASPNATTTFAESGSDPVVLSVVVARSLPQNVSDTVASLVENEPPAAQLGALAAAAVLQRALQAQASGTTGGSLTNGSVTLAVADLSVRMRECLAYLANGNATLAARLSAIAAIAAVANDSAARLFIALSSGGSNASSGVQAPLRPASRWNESCAVVFQQMWNGSNDNVPSLAGVQARAAARTTGAGGACESSNSVVDVLYINGIFASVDDAGTAAMQLQLLVDTLPESSSARTSRVVPVYNPRNYLGDLCEVLIQISTQFAERPLELYRAVQMLLAHGSDLATTVFTSNPSFQTAAAAAMAQLLEQAASNVGAFSTALLAGVRDLIAHGHSVVIVPHSQGNLYANAVFTSLSSQQRAFVRVVGVATPAAYVGLQGTLSPYATRTDDRVIAAVPFALPGNVAPSADEDGWGPNHFMVSAYLQDAAARAAIASSLRTALAGVETPNTQIAQGIITVTLRWDAQPDVDLHVIEPSGRWVYYGARSGGCGFLDRDDVTSYGPENYFVACDALHGACLGTYRVGVNYYYGNGPTQYSVSVLAGGNSATFSGTLSVPRGSSGNSSPTMVATITVAASSNAPLLFLVQSP